MHLNIDIHVICVIQDPCCQSSCFTCRELKITALNVWCLNVNIVAVIMFVLHITEHRSVLPPFPYGNK